MDFLLKRYVTKKEGQAIAKGAQPRWGFIKSAPGLLIGLLIVGLILGGLIPTIRHARIVAGEPYSISYLNPDDVAIMRFLRDIAAGVPEPSPLVRRNELMKLPDIPEPSYDTLVCQSRCYAIAHLFLHAYDEDQILSLHGGIGYEMDTGDMTLNENKKAIEAYPKRNKDLKLVWEQTPQIESVLQKFRELSYLGSEEHLSFPINGHTNTFYVLNIKNEMIDSFKEAVQKIE